MSTVVIGGGGSGVRARVLQAGTRLRAAGASAKPAAAPKSKKAAKGETPLGPTVSREIREKTVLGANTLKEGADPPIKPDNEYPDWLFRLLDKQLPLSELQRRNPETMPVEELHRFVKLDNRRRIRENNALKAKT